MPFNHTDFVFSVAGEELGFVGVCRAARAAGGGALAWVDHRPAGPGTSSAGWWPAASCCWIGLQSFENIGMNLGIMPVTGVPLPFVSYGGSSMFAVWIGIGLLLNVHAATGEGE